MKKYKDSHIGKLAEQLDIAGIDKEIIDKIMDGGTDISAKSAPEEKADWFRGAMDKMDKLIDIETRKVIREDCACCLGGRPARKLFGSMNLLKKG